MVFNSSAESPMALLLNPVVFPLSAKAPTASLNDPLPSKSPALLTIAPPPTAVFRVPSMLNSRAAAPTAVLISALLKTSVPAPAPVLKCANGVEKSEFQPNAVFAAPEGVEKCRVSVCRVESGVSSVGGRVTLRVSVQMQSIPE